MKHRITSMHILLILKMRTLVLIKWSCKFPHLCGHVGFLIYVDYSSLE
jgi:hypothetical protein